MYQRVTIGPAMLLLCAAGCSPLPEERSTAAAISDAPRIAMYSEDAPDEPMPPVAQADVILHD